MMDKKFFIGVPTRGKIDVRLAQILLYWQSKYKPTVFFTDKVIPHSAARNTIVKTFIDQKDYEWVVFVDDDVVPPSNALDIIEEDKAYDIVAGYAPIIREFKPGEQSIIMNFANFDGQVPPEPEEDYIYEVKNVGFGFIAIKKEVFDKIKKPYFDFFFKDEDGTTVRGEDIYFCDKVREAGFKIMLDPRLKCKHNKEILI